MLISYLGCDRLINIIITIPSHASMEGALFSGPTQLFVACSMEKQEEPGIFSSTNQLLIQRLECMTVAPPLGRYMW